MTILKGYLELVKERKEKQKEVVLSKSLQHQKHITPICRDIRIPKWQHTYDQFLNNMSTARSILSPSPISVILNACVACAFVNPISVIFCTASSTVDSAIPSRFANDKRLKASTRPSIIGEMWREDQRLEGLDGRADAVLGM